MPSYSSGGSRDSDVGPSLQHRIMKYLHLFRDILKSGINSSNLPTHANNGDVVAIQATGQLTGSSLGFRVLLNMWIEGAGDQTANLYYDGRHALPTGSHPSITNTWWLTMIFVRDIHAPLRMNPAGFSDALVPPTGPNCLLIQLVYNNIVLNLILLLPLKFVDYSQDPQRMHRFSFDHPVIP